MDRHILRKIEQFTGNGMSPTVVEGFEPKRAIKMDGAGKSGGSRGSERSNRGERSHTPGGRGGYQPRDNNRASFGDRIMGEKPSGRADGEKSYGPRSGGFNDRNKERTQDGARPARSSFGDRNDRPAFGAKPAFSDRGDRPAPNRERFGSNESAGNRTPRDTSGEGQREINGNSRSYTKDTDMQFARELSKGFGGRSDRSTSDRTSAPKPYARKPEGSFGDRPNRSSAPRSDAPRASTGEKFGNPRPVGDRPARAGGDSAPRRPRSFA